MFASVPFMAEEPARKRGRPKGTGRIDPADIIELAIDALMRGGYAELSLRGVARTYGVSLSTVQHHFPTKDALWRATVEHLAHDASMHRADTAEQSVADRINAHLTRATARPGLLFALLTDNSEGAEERIAYVADLFRENLEEAMTQFGAVSGTGILRDIDPRVMLTLLTIGVGAIAAASGAVKEIYGFDLDDDADRERFAEALTDIMLFGIVAR